MLNFYIVFLSITLPLMLLAYFIAEKAKRADYADLLWVLIVCSQSLIMIFGNWESKTAFTWILNLMIIAWGVKLGVYLFKRIVLSKKEDTRYAYYRETWGKSAKWKMPAIFLLQPIYAIFFGLPAVLANFYGATFSVTGLAIWMTGIIGTYISDLQLEKFKRNKNHAKVCREGLWRYSRHPNYFFEWITWCSYPFFFTHSSELFLCSLLTPAVVFWLLNYFSGIPPLEATAVKNKKQEYEEYIRTTNKFFPGPVK